MTDKTSRYDAIVIGLGGMGSATLYELSRRGLKTLGIEQFRIGHDRGSSHGQTRIIRKAYFEHPDYIPLLHSAYQKWAELEAVSGRTLIEWTGLLLAGPPEGDVIQGVKRSAKKHQLAIEQVPASQWLDRFPGFRFSSDSEVLFEADAGFLRVESCVETYVEWAQRHGAQVLTHTPVTRWSAQEHSVHVEAEGQIFQASRLLICGGAWAGELLKSLHLPLDVRRKVVLWFEPRDPCYRSDHGCPVFGIGTKAGFFYGFPAFDEPLIKVGDHTGGASESTVDMDRLSRTVTPGDCVRITRFLKEHLPGIDPAPKRDSVCVYTMTPDGQFVIDRHPGHSNVVVAAGFSGHGYKFAPVVGSVLADLAIDGSTTLPVGFLRINRPALNTDNPPASI